MFMSHGHFFFKMVYTNGFHHKAFYAYDVTYIMLTFAMQQREKC